MAEMKTRRREADGRNGGSRRNYEVVYLRRRRLSAEQVRGLNRQTGGVPPEKDERTVDRLGK